MVEYDPARVAPAEIVGAINTKTYFIAGEVVQGAPAGEDMAEGETTAGATAFIGVKGMADQRAASLVTQAVGSVGPAIADVSVNLTRSVLMVTYDPGEVSSQLLLEAINRGTPYEAVLLSTTGEASSEEGAAAQTFNYAKYVVWGIAGLFVAALAWSGILWGRRRWVQTGAHRAAHRRAGRPHRR